MDIKFKERNYSLEEMGNLIRDRVEWRRFFDVIISWYNTVDESGFKRKNLFFGSDLIEDALSYFSNGTIEWIDLQGQDHKLSDIDVTIEMKSGKNILSTGIKNVLKKKKTGRIIMQNTQGKDIVVEIRDFYSKWVLLADKNFVAITTLDSVKKHQTVNSDAIVSQVPMNELYVIARRVDYNVPLDTKPPYNIIDKMGDVRREYFEVIDKRNEGYNNKSSLIEEVEKLVNFK